MRSAHALLVTGVVWARLYCVAFLFFFSSRRRHTRCLSDWSSDVCSSDLTTDWNGATFNHATTGFTLVGVHATQQCIGCHVNNNYRSEERRGGKECRSR